MNILVDELPTHVEVSGVEHELKTDYRKALYTILAFEDSELATSEKVSIMLQNMFVEIPLDVEKAVDKCQWFLNGGKENSKEELSRRLYSFSHDAGFIFSGFRQTHGIDLQDAKLHWWKFLALYLDLGSTTTFCNLIGLRSRFYDGKCTKEEIQAINKMGDVFKVPENDILSPEEREADRLFLENYKKAKAAQKLRRSK